jgi:predicted porin
MNKKLIALAVAAAFAAPMAANAAPTVFGIAHVSVDKVNNEDTAGDTTDEAWHVVSRASRIGAKGSEDLGGGLSAVYHLEWQVAMDSTGALTGRNQVVGLSGGFGTVLMGRHDTPMKMSTGKLDFFGDEAGDYNNIAGFVDHRASNAIAYVSPNMNGFGIAAAIVPGENADADATDDANDGLTGAVSLNATYSAGALYVAGGYEKADADLVAATGGADDWNAMRLGVGYNMDNMKFAGVYEKQDSGSDAAGDRGIFQVSGAFTMGKNVIKATYAKAGEWSEADDTDHSGYAVGIDHNFSKASKLYAQYAAIKAGDAGYVKVTNGFSGTGVAMGGDESAFSIGMKTKF